MHYQLLALLSLATILSGCATPSAPAPSEPARAMTVPTDNAPPADAQRFSVISDQAVIRILAYKEGPMARLGHNHVIDARAISGSIWLAKKIENSKVSLVIPLAAMSVDQADLRAQEGEAFASELDAQAIEGTRANMLGEKLLNATQFPFARILCGHFSAEHSSIDCTISLAGITSTHRFAMTLTQTENQLTADGEVTLSHAELGLTPYSVGLGSLSVADEISVRFHLPAQRLSE